ncbi:MAG: sulfatase-like hydrolase/transferase, partial [Ardenticatenaceae bacterium]
MANSIENSHPNFLIIMSDEHGPMFSSACGHPLVQTPNMDRLALQGVTFDAAYCNAPLCVPSRLSFMTGQFVSHCQGWDNAKPLPSDAMTWPYLLRSQGYDAALSGKMHLVGLDRLHGFRAQLAFDPHADGHRDAEAARRLGLSTGGAHPIFLWEDGIPAATQPWPSVKEARAGTGSMIEADDTIEEAALAYLREPARREQPFALCVGFVAPHFPFIVPEPYFSMYYPHKTDLPQDPPGHLDNLPPAAQRLRQAFG